MKDSHGRTIDYLRISLTDRCNFRCIYCMPEDGVQSLAHEDILRIEEIEQAVRVAAGMGIRSIRLTGGEPLLQPDLAAFLSEIKEKGYLVKLDTNGSFPDRLKRLTDEKLIDFVAMDVKNSPEKYALTAGTPVDTVRIGQSIALLLEKNIPYEFRTTAVKELHTAADFTKIGRWIQGAEQYYIQCFRDSENLLSDGCSKPSPEDLQAYLAAAREYVPQTNLRGVS